MRLGLLGSEGCTPEMRNQIEERWGGGFFCTDNYGMSELNGPGMSGECRERNGLHINEDHFLCEIIDAKSGEVLEPGSVGELVYTTLMKKARPMIRFRTGDIGYFSTEKCECGRTLGRIHITGRKDEMFIVGAVNVFPSDVEYVVRAEKGLTGEYLIRVYDENFSTRYEVSVERAQGSDEPFDAVAARVTAALKAHTGVKPARVIVPTRELHHGARIEIEAIAEVR